jgi:hypothetical protein
MTAISKNIFKNKEFEGIEVFLKSEAEIDTFEIESSAA